MGDVEDLSRLTPQGRATRERIVKVAADLIFRQGGAGTSIDDVRTAGARGGAQRIPNAPFLSRQAQSGTGRDRLAGRQRNRAAPAPESWRAGQLRGPGNMGRAQCNSSAEGELPGRLRPRFAGRRTG